MIWVESSSTTAPEGPGSNKNSNDSVSEETSESVGKRDHEFNDKIEMDRGKRFDFLLKQTDIFCHFMSVAKPGGEGKKEAVGRPKKKDKELKEDNPAVHRHRKTEQEEDEELLAEEFAEKALFRFEQSPAYIKGGEMGDYQIRGLNWMVVPKSTLGNWINEFAKWCPSLGAVCLIGDADTRNTFIRDVLMPGEWDVYLTSYEMCIREKSVFKKFNWRYMLIDEAHRIKNEISALSDILREFKSTNRLLIILVPLQNNLHKLWLIKFLITGRIL